MLVSALLDQSRAIGPGVMYVCGFVSVYFGVSALDLGSQPFETYVFVASMNF